MAVDSDITEGRFDAIVVDVPFSLNDTAVYDEDHVTVYWGLPVALEARGTLATPGADYTVTLDPPDYQTVTVTPLAPLLAKIAAAGGGTQNTVLVQRIVPLTSDFTETDSFVRRKLVNETDLIAMRIMQVNTQSQASADTLSTLTYDIDTIHQDKLDAEAAAASATASASALGNQAHQYDTRAIAAGAVIPAGIQAIHTFGLATVGDGGGRTYVRGIVSDFEAFLGTGGQYWKVAPDVGATYEDAKLTGDTTAVTQVPEDSSDKVATTEFVQNLFTRPTATIYAGMVMEAYGDSITVGAAASDYAITSYAPLFANANSLNLSRWAVSGVGSVHQLGQAYIHMAQFNRVSLATWMAYHNEVYRGGSAPATVAKVKSALQGFLANCFLNLAYPANHPTQIGRTGTWAEGSAILEKAITLNGGAGRLLYATTAGYTLYWVFSGDNVVVGLFNASNTPYNVGTCTISVDGAVSGPGFLAYDGNGKSDGISDGVYDNKITSAPQILTGLGAGSHTVTVTVTSADASHPLYVDYFGTMQPATAASPVIITEAPRPNPAGYVSLPGAWSDAAFDAMDTAVFDTVAFFTDLGYPVARGRTNAFLDRVAGISGDNEHPNDIGHSQLAAMLQDVVTIQRGTWAPQRSTDLTKSGVQSIGSGVAVAISWQTVSQDDDGLYSASTPTRLTARRTCVLEVKGYINFAVNATGIRQVMVSKNGGAARLIASISSVTGDATVVQFSDRLNMLNGDYMEVFGVQNSGGALNVAAVSFVFATIIR